MLGPILIVTVAKTWKVQQQYIRLTELGQNMVDIQTITRDFGVNSGVL